MVWKIPTLPRPNIFMIEKLFFVLNITMKCKRGLVLGLGYFRINNHGENWSNKPSKYKRFLIKSCLAHPQEFKTKHL